VPELVKSVLYFVLGGFMVSVSTYFGTSGRGFLAAFVSTFPAVTGLTILLIYLNGGGEPAHAYAKHLLWLVPAWLTYVAILIAAIPRLGFWMSMAVALMVYMAAVMLIRSLVR
jgi:hypothetical protein